MYLCRFLLPSAVLPNSCRFFTLLLKINLYILFTFFFLMFTARDLVIFTS